MNQQIDNKSSEEEPASFSTLPEELVPQVVGFVRSWAEKEEVGKDCEEKLQKGRRLVSHVT